jgi:hypothetical protein
MTSTRMGLLLAMALLSTGCAALTSPRRGMNLHYTPREAAAPTLAEEPGAPADTAACSSATSSMACGNRGGLTPSSPPPPG